MYMKLLSFRFSARFSGNNAARGGQRETKGGQRVLNRVVITAWRVDEHPLDNRMSETCLKRVGVADPKTSHRMKY